MPEVAQPRVEDSKTQNALTAIFVTLREVVRFLQPMVQPTWHPLPQPGASYAPNITFSRPPEYMKDSTGRVWFRGGVDANITVIMGVMPVGFRPPATVRMAVVTGSGTFDFLEVTAAGQLSLDSGGLLTATYLDGISFDTED